MERKYSGVTGFEFNEYVENYGKKLDVKKMSVGNMDFTVYYDFDRDGEKAVAVKGVYNDTNLDTSYVINTDVIPREGEYR